MCVEGRNYTRRVLLPPRSRRYSNSQCESLYRLDNLLSVTDLLEIPIHLTFQASEALMNLLQKTDIHCCQNGLWHVCSLLDGQDEDADPCDLRWLLVVVYKVTVSTKLVPLNHCPHTHTHTPLRLIELTVRDPKATCNLSHRSHFLYMSKEKDEALTCEATCLKLP